MTFPFPIMLNGRAWGNSIWTDFKDKWNGETHIGTYSTGSFMSDWSITGASTTSQVNTVSGSISGQAYAHIANQTTGVQHFLEWSEPPSVSNCDVLAGGRVLLHPSNPTDAFGPFVRRNANGRMHAIITGSSGSPRSEVTLVSINLLNIFNTNYSFSWSTNTWYWIRVNANGGTLRVKTWARGTPEPASWDITWSPAFAHTGSGGVGLVLAGAASSSQQIDFFSFCSDGNPAWGPL